jgi:hypothetical protein
VSELAYKWRYSRPAQPAELDRTAGYYLTTRDVVLSEQYWAHAFAVNKRVSRETEAGNGHLLRVSGVIAHTCLCHRMPSV